MFLLLTIFIAAVLFAGCHSVPTRQSKPTAEPVGQEEPVGRPAWFNAPLKGGCQGADEAIAYLDGVFKGTEAPTAKHFLKAQTIVNAALVTDGDHAAILQEDSIVLGHTALLAMAHDKRQQGIQNREQLEELLLATARLKDVRQDNASRFSNWLPQLETWEQTHGDWCGLRLCAQFQDKSLHAILPELWMARHAPLDANLAQESIEQWRAAKPNPMKLSDLGKKLQNNNYPIWLMQTIEQPEVQEGMDTYAVFSAFRGRCVAFVNGTQAASFDSEGPHYFSVPLIFKDKQCNFVIVVSEHSSLPFVPLPVWLAFGKKTVPQNRP